MAQLLSYECFFALKGSKFFIIIVKPRPMCISLIGFQFHVPGSKENIFHLVKKSRLKPKFTILEFSKKSALDFKKQHFDYESISAIGCTSEGGQITKLDMVAISHNCKF